jgi:hypothetical protein
MITPPKNDLKNEFHFSDAFAIESLTLSQPINPLTPNDLQRRRAVSTLKIKISSKYMREKPTNTPIIHSVY